MFNNKPNSFLIFIRFLVLLNLSVFIVHCGKSMTAKKMPSSDNIEDSQSSLGDESNEQDNHDQQDINDENRCVEGAVKELSLGIKGNRYEICSGGAYVFLRVSCDEGRDYYKNSDETDCVYRSPDDSAECQNGHYSSTNVPGGRRIETCRNGNIETTLNCNSGYRSVNNNSQCEAIVSEEPEPECQNGHYSSTNVPGGRRIETCRNGNIETTLNCNSGYRSVNNNSQCEAIVSEEPEPEYCQYDKIDGATEQALVVGGTCTASQRCNVGDTFIKYSEKHNGSVGGCFPAYNAFALVHYYTNILVRTDGPDGAGFKYYISRMQSEGLCGSAIAKDFFYSPEFVNRLYNNRNSWEAERIVVIMFRAMLNRVPVSGSDGERWWLTQVKVSRGDLGSSNSNIDGYQQVLPSLDFTDRESIQTFFNTMSNAILDGIPGPSSVDFDYKCTGDYTP